jgi:hypothetical protein
MSRTLSCAITLLLLTLAGKAGAQEPAFGDKGHVAMSVERLFGFVHTSETRSAVGGGSNTQSQDTFTLLTNPVAVASGYAWPRVGFDVFITSRVSVGAAAGYFNVSPPNGSLSGFVFAPRVGYAGYLGPRIAIWPRGGFTFEQVSNDSTKRTAFALTLEAPLAVLISPRIAILIGPTLDLPLSGTLTVTNVSTDDKFTEFGLQAGLLVFL